MILNSCGSLFRVYTKINKSKFQYKIQKQAIFNLKSVLFKLEAIDIKNQSLNLKSSDFIITG